MKKINGIITMFQRHIYIISITLLFSFNTLYAETEETQAFVSPDNIEGSSKINAEGLINLALENKNLVIIDSRIKSDRRQGYISGSISLSDTETDCSSLFSTLEKKGSPVAFYCNGPKCRRSDRAVKIAVECGYTNIYWFRGGYEEWKNKNYLISK